MVVVGFWFLCCGRAAIVGLAVVVGLVCVTIVSSLLVLRCVVVLRGLGWVRDVLTSCRI